MPCFFDPQSVDAEIFTSPNHYSNVYKIGLEEGLAPYFRTADELTIQKNDEFFHDLMSKINEAKTIICIAQYIFKGQIEEDILSALKKAHTRGVKIFLLVDRSGSSLYLPWSKRTKTVRELPFNQAIFLDKNIFDRLRLVNIRTHSKVAFIDGKYSWLGSHNLRNEIMVTQPLSPKSAENTTLRLTGKASWQVGRYFERLWFKATGDTISVNPISAKDAAKNINVSDHDPWIRINFRDSKVHGLTLYNTIISAINHAQKRCLIWTPYFLPPKEIRNLLILAKKRGVTIELLVPKKTDSSLVTFAMINFIYECLMQHIKVYTSGPLFNHSKMLVIDDWILIGSSNFDYRSFFINHEANFEVIDPKLADELEVQFNQYKESEITLANFPVTPFKRIISNIFALPVSIY